MKEQCPGTWLCLFERSSFHLSGLDDQTYFYSISSWKGPNDPDPKNIQISKSVKISNGAKTKHLSFLEIAWQSWVEIDPVQARATGQSILLRYAAYHILNQNQLQKNENEEDPPETTKN